MDDVGITARDCSPIPRSQKGYDPDWLSNLAHVPIEDLVVRLGRSERETESLVHADPYGTWYAGRYIGHVEYRGGRITIEPRFEHDFHEWLAEALRLPVVPDVHGSLQEGPFLDRLLAVIWGAGLVRAAKHGLPHLRRTVEHIGPSVRGRLNVRKTVGQRIRGQPRLVSESRDRVLANPIVQTLVAAYQVLNRRLVGRGISRDKWIPARGRDLLPAMVRACGPRPELPGRREIRRIRYSPITETYRPFVTLSYQIARMRGGTPDYDQDHSKISGLLLDVAELWELFVVNTARSGLPDYRVVHGRLDSGPEWYVGENPASHSLQRIVPDMVLNRNGQTEVIADAKYKMLGSGRASGPPGGFERSDLYQLITYLTEAVSGGPTRGMLVYPQNVESARAEAEGPWHLRTEQQVSFVQLPRQRESARKRWAELVSEKHADAVGQKTP